jgi:hypothetical protein
MHANLALWVHGEQASIYRTDRRRLSYNITIMFCPNCAAQNDERQHYCRMCGLQLDAIAAELSEQNPSPETALLLKKQRRIEKLAVSSLSIAGIIGVCLLLAVAFYYKLAILGPEILFGSAVGALILFLLASICLFAYSKHFMTVDYSRDREQRDLTTPTNRLLNDPPFEPASVIEHSTELLRRK